MKLWVQPFLEQTDMKDKCRKCLAAVLGYGIVILGVLAILFVISLLGGSLMGLMGFRYESVGSVFLFFLLATVVSLPASLLAQAIPSVCFRRGWIPCLQARIFYVILDMLATALGMLLVDRCMSSVAASGPAVAVVSLLLALLSVKKFREE